MLSDDMTENQVMTYYDADVYVSTYLKKRDGWTKKMTNAFNLKNFFERCISLIKPFCRFIIPVPITMGNKKTMMRDGGKIIEGQIERIEIKIYYKEI